MTPYRTVRMLPSVTIIHTVERGMNIALQASSDSEEGLASPEITTIVGENLRRIRVRNGLTLERLARVSGVSRAMLGQIELGRSAPTINILWKIAVGLGVPLSVFVSHGNERNITIQRAHRSKWLTSPNGRFLSRDLSLKPTAGREEIFEVKVAPQSLEEDDGHASGATEIIVVVKGVLEVRVDDDWYRLEKGDIASFAADRSHAYRNPGIEETHFIMVRSYSSLRYDTGTLRPK